MPAHSSASTFSLVRRPVCGGLCGWFKHARVDLFRSVPCVVIMSKTINLRSTATAYSFLIALHPILDQKSKYLNSLPALQACTPRCNHLPRSMISRTRLTDHKRCLHSLREACDFEQPLDGNATIPQTPCCADASKVSDYGPRHVLALCCT